MDRALRPEQIIERLGDAATAEALFRGLLEATHDAMVIIDCEGRIVFINARAERLFGHGREDLVGQTAEMLVPERYRKRHRGHWGDYFATPPVRPRTGSSVSALGLRKDGTEFAAQIHLGPIETPDRTLVAAAIRDVTERNRFVQRESRRKSEELEAEKHRIREANRLKSEFLANMGHDLRTPLNAIMGFADLMFKGKVGPISDVHKEYLGDILNSSHHLLHLLNDVVRLAEMESGQMEFRPEPLNLGRVVEEVGDLLRGLAASKRIHVETAVDSAVSEVVLDPTKVKQVLYNFLSNALNLTPDEGQVAIHVVAEGPDCFRIAVEDSGTDLTMAQRYAGTFGLALTKGIVEAQGGRVGAQGQPGKGSTFWAVLPRSRRVQNGG